jgi:hypothetical protein
MLSNLVSAELKFLVVAVIAVVIAIGGMLLYVKTKKPSDLPASMIRSGGTGTDESSNGQ